VQSIRSLTRHSIRTLAAALLVSSVAALPTTALADGYDRIPGAGHGRGQPTRPHDDTAYRVDAREYRGSERARWNEDRHDGGYRDDRPREDRNRGDGYRGERDRDGRHYAPRWDTLAQLRTHSEGRGHQEVVLPRDTRQIRLAATHRRTFVHAAFIEYPNGRRVRVPALEGRLEGSCEAQAPLRMHGHRPAVLHLVTESVRDGRRAYFDVLAAR
jgi:hypothetical protein